MARDISPGLRIIYEMNKVMVVVVVGHATDGQTYGQTVAIHVFEQGRIVSVHAYLDCVSFDIRKCTYGFRGLGV